jgi:tetratricopeptide (TPR) repeat protein
MTDASGRPALRGFLLGTGAAATVALLGFFVSRAAAGRAPAGSMTGTVSPSAPAAVADSEVERLQEAIGRNPDDIEARLDLARAFLGRDDLMQVFDQTRAVLDRSPGHPRALTYQALVRMEMGQLETAERMLRQALAVEPDFVDAYIHLSLVHARGGRLDEAEADVEEAVRRHPDKAEMLSGLRVQLKSEARLAPARCPP